jgi:asparagine synthase (glutamine-hydrolysing)
MCGIAGIVAPAAPERTSALAAMTARIAHRGPDGDGFHSWSGCAFGHRRLSIIDLATGDQPMLSADGRVGVTFNGEIYGYRELRDSLQSDYPFRTTSDTEVLLALYEKHGMAMLDRLPGMFAFALWDDRRRRLLAARDRFGEKPFYYAWGSGGEFLFASEIKAILASGLIEPVVDRQSIGHYLSRLYVHPHRTIYTNIFVLPPAHCLSLEDGRVTLRPYWSLPATEGSISLDDAVSTFRERFERAVARQLIADVPVAAFLSGGLDSSTVVSAAARKSPHITTLTFGFGASFSELPFARELAQRYETNHIEMEDRDEDIADLLTRMAGVYDEPFADSSNIPTFLISRAARGHAKVVLTGDGGDELLAGYDFWYGPLLKMEQAGRHQILLLAISLAFRAMHRLRIRPPRRLEQLASGARLARQFGSIAEAHATQNRYFRADELQALEIDMPAETLPEVESSGTVSEAMRMDLVDYMPGDILVKTDRASMAHGLELRAPFLDVDFASFCISLPARLKIRDAETKIILRRAYGAMWTESIRKLPKSGFGAPTEEWMKRPGVKALRRSMTDDRKHPLYSLIPFEAAARFWRSGYQAWILLVLGLWADRWLRRS